MYDQLIEMYKIQLRKFYVIEFEQKNDTFYKTQLANQQGVLNGLEMAILLANDDEDVTSILQELDEKILAEYRESEQ